MKRRLFILAVFLLSFITFSSLSDPTVAHATSALVCPPTLGSLSLTRTDVETGTIVLTIVFPPGSNGNTVNATFKQLSFTSSGGTDFITFLFTPISGQTWLQCNYGGAFVQGVAGPAPLGPLYGDGRLNNNDGAETSAIYCMVDGSVRVYAPNGEQWYIAFTASPADIDKVPKHPTVNILIKQGMGARLYRLMSGELQVNSTHPNGSEWDYVFIFQDCPRPTSH